MITTYWSRTDHMIIRDNAQSPPTIDHGQQTQMIVGCPLLRYFPQRKSIQDLVSQQQLLVPTVTLEDCRSGRLDPFLQRFTMSTEHQLEKLGHRLGVLSDLLLGGRVQDGETGVHVPFVRVNPEGNVDLDVFDAANISVDLPRELVVGPPCRTHAEEGGVCDSLGVCGDPVVCFRREVDVLGTETG